MKYKMNLSYKMRNTLILSAFIVVIAVIGGFLILYFLPKKSGALQAELGRLNQQIAVLDGIEIQYATLQRLISEEEWKLANLDKSIAPNVTSSQTYAYLNAIVQYAGDLKFDILFTEQVTSDSYGYNVYQIRGEGSFEDIYKFIWYVERGPNIYKVRNLSLRGVESSQHRAGRSNLIITFEMDLCAMFTDVKNLPQLHGDLASVVVAEFKDPFNPRVKRNLPPNTENFIEVERSELKAVIPGKAFVADHSGKVRVIQVGDRVFLGYATKIDVDKNQVEFSLNKNGKVQKFVLKLSFRQ
ncbi:MAG: hypothetical protein ACOY90_00660 [Candidatus Zhuqueibacterota bacterium]